VKDLTRFIPLLVPALGDVDLFFIFLTGLIDLIGLILSYIGFMTSSVPGMGYKDTELSY